METTMSAPRAKLNWANKQIDILADDLRVYGETEPYKITSKANTGGKGVLLYLEQTKPIPELIAIHIGAILAAQRDSLDFLVTALAEKNGAKEPRDCYFPIADSEQRFLEKGTQSKIKRLTAEDRQIIHAFKPYKGGNDLLYALNWLCQKGKHRKPILFGGVNSRVNFGVGSMRSYVIFPWQDAESGAPLAAIDTDTGIDLNFTVHVSFREINDVTPAAPAIPALREFSSLATSIIDRFGPVTV